MVIFAFWYLVETAMMEPGRTKASGVFGSITCIDSYYTFSAQTS
jgi:hypothetical protein